MQTSTLRAEFKTVVWIIPATTLLIVPGFVDPINFPKLLVAASLAIATLFLLSLKLATLGSTILKRLGGTGWLYVMFVAIAWATGLFGTENVVRALLGTPGRNNGLLYYSSVSIVCLSLFLFRPNRSDIRYLIKWIRVTAVLFVAYSLIQYLNADPILWNSSFNRIIGTLGNPNFAASALGIFSTLFVIQAIAYFQAKRIGFGLVFLAATSLSFFLAFATGSLQGLMVGLTGFGLVSLTHLRAVFPSRKFFESILALGILGMTLLFLSFAGIGPLGPLLEQYTLKLRGVYASIGLKAMLENPLVGVGVDSYFLAFMKYRSEDFVNSYSIFLNTDNAHSTPAQIGSGFGLIVFLIYCLIQGLILFRAISNILSSSAKNVEIRTVSIIWILVFAQSLLSIEIIGLGVMNWVLGAVILTYVKDETVEQQLKSRAISPKRAASKESDWTGAALILSLMVSLAPFAFFAREDSAYKNIFALEMRNDSDSQWVREQFSKLGPITKWEPSKVRRILPNMFEAQMSSEIAEVIETMYAKNYLDPEAVDLMAIYLGSEGETVKEIEVRKRLRELDPLNYVYELRLAEVLASQNAVSELEKSIAKIEKLAPEGSSELKRARELRAQHLNG